MNGAVAEPPAPFPSRGLPRLRAAWTGEGVRAGDMELEDLREKPFGWRYDVVRRNGCDVVQGEHVVGEIRRDARRSDFRNVRFDAYLAELAWSVETKRSSGQTAHRLGVDRFDLGLGEAVGRNGVCGAKLDGTPYLLKASEAGRAVWRDEAGVAMASFTCSPNPRHALFVHGSGTIHVFRACPLPHAAPLVLLGLVEVVFCKFAMAAPSAAAADAVGSALGDFIGGLFGS